MIRASFCAPAKAQAPSARTASSTSPSRYGRGPLDRAAEGAAARGSVTSPRRTSAAFATGSAGAGEGEGECDATRGCERTTAGGVAPAGCADVAAVVTAGKLAPRGSGTRGRGRTTRGSWPGAAGARTVTAGRTLSPLAPAGGGGSATAASEGGCGSGAAAAALGSATGADGASAAGVGGTLGAGAATGAGTGAGAGAGAATGAAGTPPRAGRNESGST